ncbi:MAG: peptidoglycan D,D-transpeptidase FtsI family protein [Bifidobacterium crudilactis]|uniref:peptidoglycan D,D-transpeptidase FtsI family protein n=1 Tax=Bifidobacterium crudilactis TaxID=327277 RepID=UPI003F9E4C42
MNKSLRQLFTAVIVLFVILGMSTTVLMTFRAGALNADSRNSRALYHEFGVPRGSILASDGTVLAESDPSNDSLEYQRKYSNGSVFAPVTGYYSITARADRGVEASRNELLSGQSDSLWWNKFKSLISGSQNRGASIETSINPKLQTLAYSLLGNKSGSVVAIEPSTGRILAMASTPSYDPNTLAVHDSTKANATYSALVQDNSNPMLNRAIAEHYPPGSTFKVVVAAAALESGQYKEDTELPAGSSYTLPGTNTQLTNTTTAANGTNNKISMSDALAYSSNTAFAQLGVALGNKAISDEAAKLGFGSSITVDGSTTTGVPMKATASSFPDTASADRLALASIGQGDTVETPLQNAMIAAAVANNGKLMQPTIVDRVRSSDLSVISQTSPSVYSEAFSSDTAKSLTNMMKSMVVKEAPELQLSNAAVAAKSGTAQTGDNSSIDAWMIGFAPADDPKIAVAVVLRDAPSAGAVTAGPIMKQMMQEALK